MRKVGSAATNAVETEFDRAYAALYPKYLAVAKTICCTRYENKLIARAVAEMRRKERVRKLQEKYDAVYRHQNRPN